jgi:hypothetical protein
MQAFGSAGEMEFFGNRQKAAKMSQLHISPSLLITEASTASGPTCFKRAALRKVHIHDTHRFRRLLCTRNQPLQVSQYNLRQIAGLLVAHLFHS